MGSVDDGRVVRIGIAGLGMVFRLGYLKWLGAYLDENPFVELRAVADPRRAEGEKVARRFGCEYLADGFDLVREGRSLGLDAVIVNTPPSTHEQLVVDAAGGGMHVLCEKPMAATADACRRMVDACRGAGVELRISQMRRFNPAFQKIRELVGSGYLGNLVEISVEWPIFVPDIDASPYREVLDCAKTWLRYDARERFGAWRLKDPAAGGGDFLDHGPHIIDFMRWVGGEVTHVTAHSTVMVKGRNEDYTKCALRLESGATGYITTTLHDFKENLLGTVNGVVRGTQGRIDFTLPNQLVFEPTKYLRVYREPEADLAKLLWVGVCKRLPERRMRLPLVEVFRDQLDYFVHTIRGDRQPHAVFGTEDFAATGDDGLRAIEIVEFAYRSAAAPEPVWLPA